MEDITDEGFKKTMEKIRNNEMFLKARHVARRFGLNVTRINNIWMIQYDDKSDYNEDVKETLEGLSIWGGADGIKRQRVKSVAEVSEIFLMERAFYMEAIFHRPGLLKRFNEQFPVLVKYKK